VGAIHPQAMPVNLTTPDEVDRWLAAPLEDALKLWRALADMPERARERHVAPHPLH
jgi:hypothetical protein